MKKLKSYQSIPTIIAVAFLLINIGVVAQTRTSIASGNFNSISTWDCSCIPGNSENLIVSSGDTVTLVGNTDVGGVTIQAGGVMDNNGRRIRVNGNYVINGLHTGNGDIWLIGAGATIDGTGEINNGNDFEIRSFSKTILSTANITKSNGGQVRIVGAITLTNKGVLTTDRNINGNNNSSTYVNDTNATTNAGRVFMNQGIIVASAPGNTVNLNRINANQAINAPATTYHHLSTAGLGNRNLGGILPLTET